MKTFFALFSAQIALFSTSFAQDHNINTSGANGINATHGRNGSDGNGGDGTPSGQATAAESAGHISIRLQTKGKSQVQLSGKIIGNHATDLNTNLNPARVPNINLDAHGGRGGNGGFGGNGGSGRNGRDGSDATRYSSGTNGTNGERGGDGKNGSAGKNGGNGGNISVEVSEEDAQLLMLVGDINNSGGAGGDPGQNGQGGSGGRGGRGGSSHSWSTRERCGSDSKGNAQYCTRWHHKSGGSDGHSGSSGSSGTADVSGGANGTSGTFEYIVAGKKFTSRYDLRVISFEIDSENHDDIIEPGEVVTIKNIKVMNVGEMPTPKFAPVRIFVRSQGWVITLNQSLKVSESIAPDQVADVAGQIQFKVANEGTSSTGQPLNVAQTTSPRATQTGIAGTERDFKNSEEPLAFKVQYPLEVSNIRIPRNLGPGQTAKISWVIKNISSKEYGKLSNLRRIIETQLKTNLGRTTTQTFRFLNEKGQVVDLNTGFLSQIDRLAPGETITVQGTVQIPKAAEVYQKIGLDANLNLGTRTKTNETRTIQTREVTINVSYVYRKTNNSDLVLVTNHETTQAELKNWFSLAKIYGLRADVWDMSYEGGIDFNQETSDGSTLGEDLKGKLLVVLNNTADNIRPDIMVSRKQILEFGLKNKTHVHFIGGDAGTLLADMNDLIVPVSAKKKEALAKTKDELIKNIKNAINAALKKAPKEARYLGSQLVQEDDWFSQDERTVDMLRKHALSAETSLRKLYPEKRFIISYDFTPRVVEDGYVVNRIELGKLHVYETLPDQESFVSALPVADAEIHQESFIISWPNQEALLVALPLQKKLDVLSRLVHRRLTMDLTTVQIILDQIRTALLADIALEQKALRKKPNEWFGGLDMSELYRFDVLAMITKRIGFDPIQANPNSRDPLVKAYRNMLVQLASDVYTMARAVYHDNDLFNNSLFDPYSNNRIVSKATKGWVKTYLELLLGKTAYEAKIKAIEESVEKKTHKMNKQQRAGYLTFLALPVKNLIRDAALRTIPEERILSVEQLAEITSRNKTRDDSRTEYLKILQSEKGERR